MAVRDPLRDSIAAREIPAREYESQLKVLGLDLI